MQGLQKEALRLTVLTYIQDSEDDHGVGKLYKAKLAAKIARCAFVMGFINVTCMVIFEERWVRLCTDDKIVTWWAFVSLEIIHQPQAVEFSVALPGPL